MDKPIITICIPTYNRSKSLENCLNSIAIASKNHFKQFEVCISDNGSTDKTRDVVKNVETLFDIKYHRNETNLGIPRNFLKVVSMAKGEFIWLLGDDDMLLPDTFDRLLPLIIDSEKDVDFFYLNSFHLHSSFIKSKSHPFDVRELPSKMEPFSKKINSHKLPFFDLIDPKTSFDFLGGMFLCAFRKEKWDLMINKLDSHAIRSNQTFSHFDNTFPHLKIWAYAFSNSTAYFNATPMNICVTGEREWAPMEPLVRNIRLIEALDAYRQNGMASWRYYYCKNFALRNYASLTVKMILSRKLYGFKLNLLRHYFKCAFYPNVYLSLGYLFVRKISSLGSKS
ncbi:glycosyltransferase [Gammaproteobacteria bacterium]|nr:glycosyltransferase [Gammaproteobacteria bacterium]